MCKSEVKKKAGYRKSWSGSILEKVAKASKMDIENHRYHVEPESVEGYPTALGFDLTKAVKINSKLLRVKMKLTSVIFESSVERFPPLVAIDLDQLTPDEYVTLRNLGYDTQLSKITKGPLKSWKAIWEFEETLQRKWILCIN